MAALGRRGLGLRRAQSLALPAGQPHRRRGAAHDGEEEGRPVCETAAGIGLDRRPRPAGAAVARHLHGAVQAAEGDAAMNSRERIFATLRGGLKEQAADPARAAAVEERIARHPRNLVPQRAQIPHAEQVALFTAKAEALTVTVDSVPAAEDVPGRISDYLARHNLPPRLKVAPDPLLQSLPWGSRPMLDVDYGPGRSEDLVSVTPAFAGIAETGTLMLYSSPTTPTTLHFVPDH